jgi:hypothetical protein
VSLPKDLWRTNSAFTRLAIFEPRCLAEYLDLGAICRGRRRGVSLELDDERGRRCCAWCSRCCEAATGANAGTLSD